MTKMSKYENNISRNKVLSGEVADKLTVAIATGSLRLHFLEGLKRALGVVLLPDADDSVHDEDEENDKGLNVVGEAGGSIVLKVGKNKADKGGDEKDFHEDVVELLQNELPERSGGLFFQFVETILLLAFVGGLGGKAGLRVGLEASQQLFCCRRVVIGFG